MVKSDINAICAAIEIETQGDLKICDGIRGDLTIQIPIEKFLPVIKLLVNKMDCKHLSGVTAQLHPEHPNKIEVLYHFWMGSGFSIMMLLPEESPKLPEIFSILPGADFYEREVAEMFGIQFVGREDMPPLLLPDGWDQGPPFIKKEVIDE
jgi:NADH-quinone oxidoreductase subunit C